jgi:hypothetical protein
MAGATSSAGMLVVATAGAVCSEGDARRDDDAR